MRKIVYFSNREPAPMGILARVTIKHFLIKNAYVRGKVGLHTEV